MKMITISFVANILILAFVVSFVIIGIYYILLKRNLHKTMKMEDCEPEGTDEIKIICR